MKSQLQRKATEAATSQPATPPLRRLRTPKGSLRDNVAHSYLTMTDEEFKAAQNAISDSLFGAFFVPYLAVVGLGMFAVTSLLTGGWTVIAGLAVFIGGGFVAAKTPLVKKWRQKLNEIDVARGVRLQQKKERQEKTRGEREESKVRLAQLQQSLPEAIDAVASAATIRAPDMREAQVRQATEALHALTQEMKALQDKEKNENDMRITEIFALQKMLLNIKGLIEDAKKASKGGHSDMSRAIELSQSVFDKIEDVKAEMPQPPSVAVSEAKP